MQAMRSWLGDGGGLARQDSPGSVPGVHRVALPAAATPGPVRAVDLPHALSGQRPGQPVSIAASALHARISDRAEAVQPPERDRRGVIGGLRMLVITRRGAVKARTQASNQIKAFLLDADHELRTRLRRLRKAPECAQLASGLTRVDPPRKGHQGVDRHCTSGAGEWGEC